MMSRTQLTRTLVCQQSILYTILAPCSFIPVQESVRGEVRMEEWKYLLKLMHKLICVRQYTGKYLLPGCVVRVTVTTLCSRRLLREKMTVAVSRPPVRASMNRITRERGCAASVTAAVSPDLDVWQLLHVLHSDIWWLLRLHTDTSLLQYLSQFTAWNYFNKYKNKQSSGASHHDCHHSQGILSFLYELVI